ncbi:MAG: hypothetical protein CBC35_07400 [Planctomycetes bacterium TMED75]|nr:hypothetical protein [Planctomycetaceae bacterium]OUU92322.1 MAG: hypothetical protein CBC35_07400 [Planctomycetes bacterium TMED75]
MCTGKIRKGCLVAGMLGFALQIASADVVCGWNFNELEAKQAELASDYGSGVLDLSSLESAVTVFGGTSLNAHQEDLAGSALGIRGLDANEQWIELTSAVRGPVELSFAFRATASGFDENQVQMLIDGDWAAVGSFGGDQADGAWHRETLTLPASDGTFRVRLFLNGAESSSGTIRFDNLQITPVSAPGALLACSSGCIALRSRRH